MSFTHTSLIDGVVQDNRSEDVALTLAFAKDQHVKFLIVELILKDTAITVLEHEQEREQVYLLPSRSLEAFYIHLFGLEVRHKHRILHVVVDMQDGELL